MSRTAVTPLRFAILASRKPGVAFPGHPFDACVSPLEAAGEHFCAFAFLRRAESRWFANPWQTPLGACAEPLVRTLRSMTSVIAWWLGARRYSFLLEASHGVHIDVLSRAIGIANQCAFNDKAKPFVQPNG